MTFPILPASSPTGYNLDKSLRFRASASAYLNRTPVAGNRQIWTWSAWVKRGVLGTRQVLFSCNAASDNSSRFFIEFGNSSDDLSITAFTQVWRTTTQLFRDPSAWYHIVVNIDTPQATASNRVKVYVNGAQVTAFSASNDPALNASLGINQASAHSLGQSTASSLYFDGYMTEVNFIDGQALTPASFGSFNALTGVWQPAPYTGTYGTNGFYLDFETTTSVAALGNDKSGNGNTWTVNNISLTAGVTFDSMTDVPTLTSATAANYAVLNPLDKDSALTVLNGNMDVLTTSASVGQVRSSFGMSSGKWYWEFTCGSSGNQDLAGIVKPNATITTYVGFDANGFGYYGNNGQKYTANSGAAYGAAYTLNDVIGVAFDANAGTLTFYKNNVSQGTAFTGLTSGPYFAAHSDGSSGTTTYAYYNFGQRPFSYTPPAGFVALNTFNLPTATILKGNTVMDATLYTGNGSTQTITNAAGFQPDLVWAKGRSGATDHAWYDSVRGVQKQIESNNTGAETTETTGLTAFGSTGFTVGALAQMNTNAATYVGWQWKAGGAAVSNTSGSITSSVSANTSAGFSVVTYTGTGANATVGHGLGVAPSFIVAKNRSTGAWYCYHVSLGAGKYVPLSSIDAATNDTAFWNNTTPSSTVFSISTGVNNISGNAYVAYCWSEIDGFSKFGSYTGNGAADGTFVYTGFRPKWVMFKISSGTGNWFIRDTSRDTYNASTKSLFPNLSDAENVSGAALDILSNGFKLRATAGGVNGSGETIIYAAYAENPFRNSLAR